MGKKKQKHGILDPGAHDASCHERIRQGAAQALVSLPCFEFSVGQLLKQSQDDDSTHIPVPLDDDTAGEEDPSLTSLYGADWNTLPSRTLWADVHVEDDDDEDAVGSDSHLVHSDAIAEVASCIGHAEANSQELQAQCEPFVDETDEILDHDGDHERLDGISAASTFVGTGGGKAHTQHAPCAPVQSLADDKDINDTLGGKSDEISDHDGDKECLEGMSFAASSFGDTGGEMPHVQRAPCAHSQSLADAKDFPDTLGGKPEVASALAGTGGEQSPTQHAPCALTHPLADDKDITDAFGGKSDVASSLVGTGREQSHTQHAPCALIQSPADDKDITDTLGGKSDTASSLAASGSKQSHTQHAPCAQGQSSLQHPAARSNFYLYAKHILPDVYGDSDDDLVGFPFDRDVDADVLDFDATSDEQDINDTLGGKSDAALPLVGTGGEKSHMQHAPCALGQCNLGPSPHHQDSPASSSLDSLAALERFGYSLDPGPLKDTLMAFVWPHHLLLEKAAALRSATCGGTEHAQQAPCAHVKSVAAPSVGFGGNSHTQHAPCAQEQFHQDDVSQNTLVLRLTLGMPHTPCAKDSTVSPSKGKGKRGKKPKAALRQLRPKPTSPCPAKGDFSVIGEPSTEQAASEASFGKGPTQSHRS